jgi:hypothetical protein
MRIINPTKTSSVFAPLLAFLYAFPANAAAPAPNTTQLVFWLDTILLILLILSIAAVSFSIARNRDKRSIYVDGNPTDRKIVLTCVTIMWSCVAVAWVAVVATAVHQLNKVTLNETVRVISVAVPMTIIALNLSIPNTRLQRRRTLMIIGVVAVAVGLAASLLTACARIAPLQAILRSALLHLG